ncbi:MAG: excinuclease ABC subunit UvrA [Verrucomicrobiota bacterium]|nr:excinuclease ABC subunit UvrA [Verrucomicrobiota bacterium]MDP7049996.1 excinuclease ABC subunit UvrA [Verrucomicrobiota bacterium]
MPRQKTNSLIRLRGVRHNNLKNLDLDLPKGKLIVFTGLSGSGKSSLAFDTLFAEGQRRYVETFSPYVRQFFDRMDKPQVDRIEGIPPAIALGQRNTVRTTRSTIGTMTEICDHMKQLWTHLAQCHCDRCGSLITRDQPLAIWKTLSGSRADEVLITFDVPLAKKISLEESLQFIVKQGYQRILNPVKIEQGILPEVLRIEEAAKRLAKRKLSLLSVLQDRFRMTKECRTRFLESVDQAYQFGKGHLAIHSSALASQRFSRHFHCATCDLGYRDPSPSLFSFNNPIGACPECRGFGRIISIDYRLALPDVSLSIAGGVVKPWQTKTGAECQRDMMRAAKRDGIPTDVPFRQLPRKIQDWVINGEPDYGKPGRSWPNAWYGVAGYFRWLESKAYKMHVRVLLSRYRSYTTCPACEGQRFKPESLHFKLDPTGNGDGITLADFYRLPIRDAATVIDKLVARLNLNQSDALTPVLTEVQGRLDAMVRIGLGYLTLDRATRTLSGGETQRVNLTACLGSRLVNMLYVLDEPSVGLHPRDTGRLVGLLENLRDLGNTLIVVEHETGVIRRADHVVDLGPGRGESGGEIVFNGPGTRLTNCRTSVTAAYLSGRRQLEPPPARAVTARTPQLRLAKFTRNNLSDFAVDIPLGRLVCVTGVSGSGKTTLIREGLLPALLNKLCDTPANGSSAKLTGWRTLKSVMMVDQSSLGRTPRSNPAVYIGAFDDIRKLFAASPEASTLQLPTGAFSFNSALGQCGHCRGTGFEKVEMQFLSDVFIKCPECNGRRYRDNVLEARLTPPQGARLVWNIADLLEATADEAIAFLDGYPGSRPADRARAKLQLLSDVGLGYLRLGQPVNTLSGGESQRLKLIRSLAEAQSKGTNIGPTLYLFDEPTTGLHFDDVRLLAKVLHRLVDESHSVIVVEHNLDLIRQADWVIDLGPDAGDEGGQLTAEGSPVTLAKIRHNHTARALRNG